ncbi:hypothetical protein HELRODRAFT_146282, partial [Helobdella robusta]|uniref:Uncharacterized protein n=1 Tax=Helobdella robusta TaxID=6412 RepID=T1EJR5_HELRO
CFVPNCFCAQFGPGNGNDRKRICENCQHGWIEHGRNTIVKSHTAEVAFEPTTFETVYRVASLFLFGCQACPIRLRILMDRLFQCISPEQANSILSSFGWSYDDYNRGYIAEV